MNNANDKLGDVGFEFREGVQDAWKPNDGQHFKGYEEAIDPYVREGGGSEIIKVDGVEAYSQTASLYKGTGVHTPFVPQPGLDVRIGRMPPGKANFEPKRQKYPRQQSGFAPQGPYDDATRVPVISPLPTGIETSTTNAEAIHTTVRDLKRELNIGKGSRTNKYVLEIDIPVHPAPGVETLNILCLSTSFPERKQHTASVWRFGRKYNLRGETDYGGTWAITFVDDSALSIRKALDAWAIDIDDSSLQDTALNKLYLREKQKMARNDEDSRPREQGVKTDWYQAATQFVGRLPKYYESSKPRYQTDIRVYQLDQVGNKTMGYLIQNAFLSEISNIEYADEKQNELTQMTATITFSEFVPLTGNSLFQRMIM